MNSEKQTVLVVDDTLENIDVLKGMLRENYKIKVALSGVKALSLIEKSHPDIILLDVMMPEMNGYEVCTILKNNPTTKHIPIIFVTGKNQTGDETRGFKLGAVDYITKPVIPDLVQARIKTHLALANQERELTKKVKEQTKKLGATKLKIIKKLGLAAEYKDNDTGLHVDRMSKYCYHIAKEYGFQEEDAELLLNASPMHDIGKIGVPDDVLKKTAKLNPEEWELMKTHSEIGAQILRDDEEDELLNLAEIIALEHHEKWNGKGYPSGKKGEEISIYARIAAVSDVFDALTSIRPYKNAWPVEKAVNLILDEAGEHFDPKVVEAFSKALPEILKIKENLQD